MLRFVVCICFLVLVQIFSIYRRRGGATVSNDSITPTMLLHFGTTEVHSFTMERCAFLASLHCRDSCSVLHALYLSDIRIKWYGLTEMVAEVSNFQEMLRLKFNAIITSFRLDHSDIGFWFTRTWTFVADISRWHCIPFCAMTLSVWSMS